MLRETERAASRIFIWWDEKVFTVEVVTNKQIKKNYARSYRDLLVNVREVISDAGNLFALWFGLLLCQTWEQISLGLHWWRREGEYPS